MTRCRTAATRPPTQPKRIKFEPLTKMINVGGRPRKAPGMYIDLYLCSYCDYTDSAIPPALIAETKYPSKLTMKRNDYRDAVLSGLSKFPNLSVVGATIDTTALRTGDMTGMKNPEMTWAPERRSGEPVTVFRFSAEVLGVPFADFKSPGAISSNQKLDDLIEGFASGRIRWVRLSRAEIMRRKRMHGIESIPNWVLAARADAASLRPIRPVETSPWLRKGSVNKTSEFVSAAILEAERMEEFEAQMARERAAEVDEVIEDDIEDAVWADEE